MDFVSPSQSDEKENIPPLSSKRSGSLPVTSLSRTVVSKRTRRPLEDITNRFHFHPTVVSASGSGSLPLLLCRTNCRSAVRLSSADLDLAFLGLHRANPRKRPTVDDRNATQRSCRMSLRKDFR